MITKYTFVDNGISYDLSSVFVNRDLFTDGGMWSAGYNLQGQLGLDDISHRSSPVQVGSLLTWKQVACGINHVLGIRSDRSLWAWGDNYYTQLGGDGLVGVPIDFSSPVQVGALTTWASIEPGDYFTIAVKTDGTLWAWGANINGELGLGTNGFDSHISSPVQVGALTNWKQVASGRDFNTAIKIDGSLWSWGSDAYGQLGLGDQVSRSSPVQVGALTDWKQVACGASFFIAVKTDGTLWGCGYNSTGQLGYTPTGFNARRSSPVQIGSLANWSQVACGSIHATAIKTDGTLWTWGYNGLGGLGLGDTVYRSSPVQVGALTDWSYVASSSFQTAAIKTDGTLWTWGDNLQGQLGLGNTTNRSSPVQVGTLTNWSKVASGRNNTVAVKIDGTLWSWGSNFKGQLGLGDNYANNRSSPVQVGALTNWANVACGYQHTVAIKTDDTLWSWGYNNNGQLGAVGYINGIVQGSQSRPVQVGALTDWKQVSAGKKHSIAIKTDGTLWGWGYNTEKQLSNLGEATTTSSPVQIFSSASIGWKQVSAGGLHTALIHDNGSLWTCGYNADGQLGTGDTYTTVLGQIGPDFDWDSTSCGYSHTAAIKTNGTLWVCGYNSSGELGLGEQTSYSSLVQVGILTDWKQVSGGDAFTAAVKTNGTLWTWGLNINGQLGLGDVAHRSSPVQVGALTDWKQVVCGSNHTAAIKTDGTLWAWGFNGYGQLNIGDVLDRSSPVQIGSLTNWKQAAAGSGTLIVVKDSISTL